MTQAYPLQWPIEHDRTPPHKLEQSRFDVSPARARDEMISEIHKMGGRNVVISTNVELRRDGLPYANRKPPDDAGVAVYFQRNGKPVCFTSDRHPLVWENMRSIGKTVEAMRGIERWGSKETLDRAFTGFTALPSPDTITPAPNRAWWVVLGVSHEATDAEIQAAWKSKIRGANDTEKLGLNLAREKRSQ